MNSGIPHQGRKFLSITLITRGLLCNNDIFKRTEDTNQASSFSFHYLFLHKEPFSIGGAIILGHVFHYKLIREISEFAVMVNIIYIGISA